LYKYKNLYVLEKKGRLLPKTNRIGHGRCFSVLGRCFSEGGRFFPEYGNSFPNDGRQFFKYGRCFSEYGRQFSEGIFTSGLPITSFE
jgi:hypothetical protein